MSAWDEHSARCRELARSYAPDPEHRKVGSEEAKLEWACRQIESLLRRVAELEAQIRELNPGLPPSHSQYNAEK